MARESVCKTVALRAGSTPATPTADMYVVVKAGVSLSTAGTLQYPRSG